MGITIFQFKDGRLIYGNDNFVYFEPSPRFTINRNNNMLIIAVGDDETSIELKQVMEILGLKDEKQLLNYLCESYFSQSQNNAMRTEVSYLQSQDLEIAEQAFLDFKEKINH